MYIYIYIYTKKGERTTSKFKTTKLPKIHTYTHTKKKIVSETQNHSSANTHTHARNYKHIKYQRRVKQTKVKTVQERGTTTPI